MSREGVLNWVNEHSEELIKLSDHLWGLAEVGLHEHKSAKAIADVLRANGFAVEEGVASMPSAFVATYGNGKPVIAVLGEYDALPGLSQKASPEKSPLHAGAAGHGCGHNLLGVGALGGALAAKAVMEAHNLAGTIRYYGCPAEETLVGKVFMVREGLFKDVDASLTWHPGTFNTLWAASTLAMNSAKFTFYGRSSHAAGDPENGRSALDAVELMNVGANYLREHIVQDARLHYVITKGGGEPNVVPPVAEVWYYVRAPKRKQVDEIYARLRKVAEGAALMTETRFEVEFLTGCYNTLHNHVLGNVLMDCFHEAGAPTYSHEDNEFARQMIAGFPPGHYQTAVENARERLGVDVTGKYIMDFVTEPYDIGKISAGSTDVGDVSWVTPTAQFMTACNVLGTPGHSWQYAACAGMGIGHKGMLAAAKVLGLGVVRLLEDSRMLKLAQDEFKISIAGREYSSPLPEGHKPPLHQLNH